MAISLKHSKVSTKSDGADPDLLQPSDWNAEHNFVVQSKRLIGNSEEAEGQVEEISIGTGLELSDGVLGFDSSFSDSQVIVAAADTDFPSARAVIDTATVTWDKPGSPNENQIKANVPDNAITLPKMQAGTQGDILYYGAAGAPTRLATGLSGMVLKSGSAAIVGPPAVAATNPSWGFSGAPHAVLRDKKGNGVDGGAFTVGDWRDRALNDELYDPHEFVTLASNLFTLVAGTYSIEWSAPAFSVTAHQTRLWNKTDSTLIEVGTPEVSGTIQTRSIGVARFTIPASKNLAIQHRCHATKSADGFGSATNYSGHSEIYTIVKIWRVT